MILLSPHNYDYYNPEEWWYLASTAGPPGGIYCLVSKEAETVSWITTDEFPGHIQITNFSVWLKLFIYLEIKYFG